MGSENSSLRKSHFDIGKSFLGNILATFPFFFPCSPLPFDQLSLQRVPRKKLTVFTMYHTWKASHYAFVARLPPLWTLLHRQAHFHLGCRSWCQDIFMKSCNTYIHEETVLNTGLVYNMEKDRICSSKRNGCRLCDVILRWASPKMWITKCVYSFYSLEADESVTSVHTLYLTRYNVLQIYHGPVCTTCMQTALYILIANFCCLYLQCYSGFI